MQVEPLLKQGWMRAAFHFAGVAIIILVFQLYANSLLAFIGFPINGTNGLNETYVLYIIMATCIVLFTWLCRCLIDRKSVVSLGFQLKGYSSELLLGIASAIAVLGIGTLTLAFTGLIVLTLSGHSLLPVAAQFVFMLIVAFAEELLFRGYMLNNLMQSINKWLALAITALLFALFHQSNPDVTPLALINIVLAGFLLGLNYIFTRNLWFGIAFHFTWNAFQGPVLGYDVSGLNTGSILRQITPGADFWTGGPFGFEGSLLCPILFFLLISLLTHAFVKRYHIF